MLHDTLSLFDPLDRLDPHFDTKLMIILFYKNPIYDLLY